MLIMKSNKIVTEIITEIMSKINSVLKQYNWSYNNAHLQSNERDAKFDIGIQASTISNV